jgi:hypothetical protein
MLKVTIAALAAAALLAGAGAASATSKHSGGGWSFLHAMKTEGGKTCFADYYIHGKGRAATEAEAQAIAGQSWAMWVGSKYGKEWAAWDLASDASMTCFKGERSYSCFAHAAPCRY